MVIWKPKVKSEYIPPNVPIIYCGIAHAFEYLSNQWSCLEALHPALGHCMLLEISLVKGCSEALHPNPFVWLVCKLVRNLVCFLDCSSIPQIGWNDFPELDFWQKGSNMWMHLHALPKERLPTAPRTWKELALLQSFLFSMLQWFF